MDLPASEPVHLRDELDIATLVAYLRSESRERPVVVLTTGPDQHAPYVSVDQVTEVAAGRADVVVIVGDLLIHALSDRVTREAGVYRGACRVYPPGTAWETQPYSTPLHMARDPQEIEAQPNRLLTNLRQVLTQLDRTRQQSAPPGRPP